MKRPTDIKPVSVPQERLKTWLSRLCPQTGIELVGAVALPCELPHQQQWLQWVADGRHGDLEYLTREPENRANPSLKNPWARSVLVMAHRYTAGWPEGDSDPSAGAAAPVDSPWIKRVSRYARGADYHDVLLKAMRRTLRRLTENIPGLVAYASTDTGPYLEREYAWLAGLGFLGHNHCLIHEKLGSGLFLGVALTNLEIENLPQVAEPAVEPLFGVTARRRRPPEVAPLDLCGSCTRCIDACPTSALDPVRGLDAHRCLSTWSIEWQGKAPAESAHEQGGLLFGCDICQAVCPWNNRAHRYAADLPQVNDSYDELKSHGEMDLRGLEKIDDDEFRRLFRKTPLWRCHPEGMRLNARRVRTNLEKESSP